MTDPISAAISIRVIGTFACDMAVNQPFGDGIWKTVDWTTLYVSTSSISSINKWPCEKLLELHLKIAHSQHNDIHCCIPTHLVTDVSVFPHVAAPCLPGEKDPTSMLRHDKTY